MQTPFLDRHNDVIQIYVRVGPDGQVELTDDGYVLNDLAMCGYDVDASPRRRELLEAILRGHGVARTGDDLTATCKAEAFGWKKHNYIQAILEINDLFYLSKPTVESLFVEDVLAWFDEHLIPYTPDLKLTGRSGLDHHFDIAVPMRGNRPERLIRAVNHPDKNSAIRLTHSAMDLREVRPRSQTVAFVNDTERHVPSDFTEALKQYGIWMVPWRSREGALSTLTEAA